MTYKKRLHALNPCTSKEKAFLKPRKNLKKIRNQVPKSEPLW